MATHSNILAWKIQWTEQSDRLHSVHGAAKSQTRWSDFTFPKMGKEIVTQVQETQRVPNRINPRQNALRHILIKLTKIKHKEQILKAAREKQ